MVQRWVVDLCVVCVCRSPLLRKILKGVHDFITKKCYFKPVIRENRDFCVASLAGVRGCTCNQWQEQDKASKQHWQLSDMTAQPRNLYE